LERAIDLVAWCYMEFNGDATSAAIDAEYAMPVMDFVGMEWC
jgi:hypothetical protein